MFAGMHVNEIENMFQIDQDFYMSKTEQALSEAKFGKFAPIRMTFVWITNTRSKLMFEISQIELVGREI